MGANLLEEAKLVAWLQHFVRRPSQQSDLQERDPEIHAFIHDCAAPLLTSLGAECRYDAMGNLIVEAGPAHTGRSLMFVTYAMTHPAARMTDPFSGSLVETQRGTAVRGRGVAEQKTALAAACGALGRVLGEGRLGGRLIFTLLTAGETGRHDAIESVMAEIGQDPQAAIVCIGTDNRIAVGNKGRVDFDLVVEGRAAHSSMPWTGVNALSGAWRVLERLDGFRPDVRDHPAFGPATLTPTAIESRPRATHTVPDSVRITFDRRLLPGEDPEEAFAAIVGAVSLDPPWTLRAERGPVMHPNEIGRESRLYAALAASFAKAGLGAPEDFHCNFALDAGYLSRRGIEAVMLGPGEVAQFHSDEESVLVADLVRMANVYHALIEEYLWQEA